MHIGLVGNDSVNSMRTVLMRNLHRFSFQENLARFSEMKNWCWSLKHTLFVACQLILMLALLKRPL